MRILLLIKTNHPDQSNPKYYAQRRWFFSKTSWKKPILLLKCLVRPWSGRPVLTFGKRPKIMTLCILEVHLNFLWWCASKTEKTKVSKLHSIRVSHIFGAWNSVWDDLSSRLGYVFKYYHDDDDDYYSPPKGHLSTKAIFFLAGWGWGGGGADSPHVHSCSMATFFCPKVAVVKWFNCTSIIYYMTREKH